jgi:O-acetylserine/cysteine efflux transporter
VTRQDTAPKPSLPPLHFLLALAVVGIWGTNFVVIHHGLKQFPPFTFAALRFAFAVFPAILFLPRPTASMKQVAAYGLLIGVGQFGLLYLAMNGHITPGLASLVVQTQVFFTIGFTMLFYRERLAPLQWAALGLCALGLAVIALATDGSASALGLALVVAAGASWGVANLISRAIPGENVLSFIVWSSLFSVPPLILIAALAEGPDRMIEAVRTAGVAAWGTVLWQSAANTLFGYGVWSWLLSRHQAALIVPTALLVPVFGMSASMLLLGESMPVWKVAAAAIIVTGLGLNLLASRRGRRSAAAGSTQGRPDAN